MIEVSGLYKKYGTFLAVKNVSFSIEKGEVIGLLGPNGAGKSTIMNILTGYISLTRGTVKVDGFDITVHPEKAKARIGYLPEIPPLYLDMKVYEYLNFIYDLKKVKFPKKPHIEEIMRLIGIDNVKNRLIKNLSKGYRQRVGFAQALVGNPDVLILDEPTVGLDPKQIIEIRTLIERLSKNHTIIVSSHILSEIQAVCKRVIIINKGTLVADGNLEELSNKVSNGSALNISVKGADELEKKLSEIPSVKSAKQIRVNLDGTVDFEVTPNENADIREAVFDAVTSSGGKILNLANDSTTLEQIYLRLTENVDNTDALALLNDGNAEETEEKEEEENESDI